MGLAVMLCQMSRDGFPHQGKHLSNIYYGREKKTSMSVMRETPATRGGIVDVLHALSVMEKKGVRRMGQERGRDKVSDLSLTARNAEI